MALVSITPPAFDVLLDIRYASANNFTSAPVYKRPACHLNGAAAEKLQKAIDLARPLGLRLKIFDAFRPLEAQQALWNHTPDPHFLSHPETGSRPHCRGAAVDLTLIDRDNVELDMGTEFDAFTPLSFHGNTDIPAGAQANRFLLMGIMTTAGWDHYKNEWWHYQLFNSREFPVLSDKAAGTGMM